MNRLQGLTYLLLAVGGLVASAFMAGAVGGAGPVFDDPPVPTVAPASTASSGSSSTSSTSTTRPPASTSSSTATTVTLPATTVPPVTEPPVPATTLPPVPTTVPPVPEVTVPPSSSGVEQWRGLVAGFDWNVDVALCLMGFESGGNPNAYNSSSGASGLMQVLASWADNFGYQPADLFIPEVNLAISHALYVDGGWSHWSPWNRGECH